MDFLNHHLNLKLYADDAFLRAEQLRLMDLLEKLPLYLLKLVLSHGESQIG
jgi:hypothetical protein